MENKKASRGEQPDFSDTTLIDLLRMDRDLMIALGSTSGLEEAFKLILDSCLRSPGIDSGGIYLASEQGGLHLAHHQGLTAEFADQIRYYPPDSDVARFMISGETLYRTNAEPLLDPIEPSRRREGLKAILVIPILHQNRTIAALCLASHAQAKIPEIILRLFETTAARIGGMITRIGAQQALRQSELRFRAVFNNSSTLMALLTPDGKILEINQAALGILGLSTEETHGIPFWELPLLPGRQSAEIGFHDSIARAAAGETLSGERHLVDQDGQKITLAESIRPIYDETGKIAFIFAEGNDITLLKEAMLALRKAKDDSEQRVAERTAELAAANSILQLEILERRRSEDALRRSSQTLSKLNEMSRAILGVHTPNEIAEISVKFIHQLIPCQRISVAVIDNEAQQAEIIAVLSDRPTRLAAGKRVKLDAQDLTKLLQLGHPVLIQDVRLAAGFENEPECRPLQEEGILSSLKTPLRAGGELTGWLCFGAAAPNFFTVGYVELASRIANELATAIQNARLFEELQKANATSQALSRRLVEVQELERRGLARELHDEIGQLLTGLNFTLKACARGAPPETEAQLEQAVSICINLISKVQEMSLNLRPTILDDRGAWHALAWHFEHYTKTTGVQVRFGSSGFEEKRFATEVETALYRIIQEALTNVARHAGVKKVLVNVKATNQMIKFKVADQGAGFDLAVASASAETPGLAGMYERAALVGGKLHLITAPGKGTQVLVEIPLTERTS